MLIQLSSGQGPCECELAVKKLYDSLKIEFPDLKVVQCHSCKFCSGYTSIVFSTKSNLSFLDGTVEWQCRSPIRKTHKRKNWFVNASVIEMNDSENSQKIKGDVRVQFFRCGGNGGQNVNKVETGVRLIHEESGIVVTATEERSQVANRKIAEKKLLLALKSISAKKSAEQMEAAWIEHKRLVRGNPIRIYKGEKFELINIEKNRKL